MFVCVWCNVSCCVQAKTQKDKATAKQQQYKQRKPSRNKNTNKTNYSTSSRPLDHEEISLRFRLDEMYLFFLFFSKVVCFCFYLNLFAYTCKNLTRLGNHNQKTKKHKTNKQPSRKTKNKKYRTSSRPLDHEEMSLRFRLDELFFVVFLETLFVLT